jgi:hypothetical protein
MFAKPQAQHQWLDQLLGDWNIQHHCQMPDGTKSKTHGSMTCRSLGGMWLICESEGGSPDGEAWSSIMTVGFDASLGRFVGTFVASMISNIWHYQGDLDDSQSRLPLECEGPKFDGVGTCPYRDTIEIVDANRWLFTSEFQTEQGQWVKFLDGMHARLQAASNS